MGVFIHNNQTIVSVNSVNGKLEVIRRIKSNMCYANGEPYPDKIFKDIYESVNNMVVCTNTIEGDVTPARLIPEVIHFAGDPS